MEWPWQNLDSWSYHIHNQTQKAINSCLNLAHFLHEYTRKNTFYEMVPPKMGDFFPSNKYSKNKLPKTCPLVKLL